MMQTCLVAKSGDRGELDRMSNTFTAYVMPGDEWYIAYCGEVPSANGQGRTKEEALESLAAAIELVFECNRDEVKCELTPEAEQTTVVVG